MTKYSTGPTDLISNIDDVAINLNCPLQSYAWQDASPPPHEVEDDGVALQLTGNSWIKLSPPTHFEIASDTLLRFALADGMGSNTHASGLNIDNNFANANSVSFQLAGSHKIGAVQYDYAGGLVTYEIDLGNYTGQTFDYLAQINDNAASHGAEAAFSDVRSFSPEYSADASAQAPETAGVTTFSPEILMASMLERYGVQSASSGMVDAVSNISDVVIDFNDPLKSYAWHDPSPTSYVVEDGGATLRLIGTTWKKLALPTNFEIASDTVLQFSFELADGIESKIHAIGLDVNNKLTDADGVTFQLAGSYKIGTVQYDYAGGVVTYEIDLGNYAGQNFDYLTLINDDPGGYGAEAVFSDVRFISGAAPNAAPTAAAIDAGAVLETDAAVAIDLLADAAAADSDGDPLSVLNVGATDNNGANVAVTLNGSILTIDPAQFADALNAGDTATVTVAYQITDGKGGVIDNAATLTILGEDPAPNTFVSGQDTPDGYNIEVVFSGTWTDALKLAFVDASERISDFVTGDLPDINYNGHLFDDVRVAASLEAIDGVGGILGQAGPTLVRTASYLPIDSIMSFDSADAEKMLSDGIWGDVIFHEMMHSIGFGALWSYLGLLTDINGDVRFNGDNAKLAYAAEFPAIALADDLFQFGVPVETDGGPGTAGAHWDEATFGNEVMTGYVDVGMFLSGMTIASLEDMGYETIWDAAALIA